MIPNFCQEYPKRWITIFSWNYLKDEGDGKRFQIGMQIGATVNYKKFNAGVSYGFDLNEIMKETKTNKLALTIGYNF